MNHTGGPIPAMQLALGGMPFARKSIIIECAQGEERWTLCPTAGNTNDRLLCRVRPATVA